MAVFDLLEGVLATTPRSGALGKIPPDRLVHPFGWAGYTVQGA